MKIMWRNVCFVSVKKKIKTLLLNYIYIHLMVSKERKSLLKMLQCLLSNYVHFVSKLFHFTPFVSTQPNVHPMLSFDTIANVSHRIHNILFKQLTYEILLITWTIFISFDIKYNLFKCASTYNFNKFIYCIVCLS